MTVVFYSDDEWTLPGFRALWEAVDEDATIPTLPPTTPISGKGVSFQNK